METQIKTAKEVLAQIERRYFKGAGLAKAIRLEGDERRVFRACTGRAIADDKVWCDVYGDVAVRRVLDGWRR